MENFQIRKSLRFKLESNENNNLINETTNQLSTRQDFDLVNFSTKLDNFRNDLTDYLFYKDKQGDLIIKKYLILKNDWLKTYAKQQFFICKNSKQTRGNQRVQFTIEDCELEDMITEVRENVYDICDELYERSRADLHERYKRSGIAVLLNRLNTKNNLPFLVDLVKLSIDKKETSDLSIRLKSDGEELLKLLKQAIEHFLPEQSSGMCIAKASFNYHTINKKSINFDKEIKNIESRLLTSRQAQEKNKGGLDNNVWRTAWADVNIKANGLPLCLGDSPFMEVDSYASLRNILKNILATQKSQFNEAMQRGDSYSELKESDLYLFNDISRDEYDKYFNYTEKIEELATKRNQTHDNSLKRELASKIERLKKDRGSLISEADRRNSNYFRTYKAFAKFYRKVAQSHGRELAKLLGIEKEKVESQLLGYWAMIIEEKGQHKLALIPRKKANDLKRRLEEYNNPKEEVKLYWFESFTYRSLQKLCFGNLETNTNTFYPELRKDRALLRKFSSQDKNGYPKFISGEHEFKGDELKKIDFYQSVLASDCAKNKLNLPYDEVYNNVVNKQFDNLEDFKIALEQVCYKRCITTNKHLIENLASEFSAQIFDITSLDLRRESNTKDKAEKYTYKEKRPTELWRDFWKEENEEKGFDIRLNPEISIIYRKAKESRIEKYGADSKKNNRYLHDQFTLVMTFNEHCNTPTKNLAFANINDEQKVIEEFNERFKKENIRFALGIDNGEVELSTLGVYFPEFEKESIEEKLAELRNVEKYGFDTLTIRDLKYKEKDYNGENKEIIKNVSYFLKEDLYCRTFGKTSQEYKAMFEKVFEKKRLLSLDLSAAKLVCGHIVTNGDVMSLYNLWLKHAQRNIYDMNDHSKREGGKRVYFKNSEDLNSEERRIFIAYLNEGNDKYNKLSEEEKNAYVDWLYEAWAGNEVENKDFEKVYKEQKIKGDYLHNVLLGATYIGEELQDVQEIANIDHIRHVFKFREDFEQRFTREEIKEEIDSYNKRKISNEVLDLNLNKAKSSIVANVIGIVDFLYKDYKNRFGGEGIVVKEGFGISKVEGDRMKFSGNIYRMLERKLYQKFQNYGLVPPVKNITEFRGKDNAFVEFGNICFINYEGTSQRCPVCGKGKLNHTETCSENCGFKSEGIMHSNDGIAGFNIAKKGFIEVTKK